MIEYLEIFKGDDSDFSLNQRISIKLLCDYDLSGMTAEVQVYDYIQTYNPIPANKRLPLVFPAAVTKKFPLGRCMAKIRLFDKDGKRRTIENKLGVIITNSIDCLSRQDINYTMMLEVSYDDLQDKPKIGDVTIEGAHDPHYYGLATKDDILSGAKTLLPNWLTPTREEPPSQETVRAVDAKAGDALSKAETAENKADSANTKADNALAGLESKADKTTTYTKFETDEKITANVENSVTSTSTTKALSANMGKELQDQIQNLKHSKADEAKPSFSTITINGVDYTEWTLGTRSGKIILSVNMGGISTEIAAFNPVTGVFESAPSQYRNTLRFDGKSPVVGVSPTLFDHVARESALDGKLDDSHNTDSSAHNDIRTALRGKRDYDDRSWGNPVSGVKSNGDYSVIMEERDGAHYYRKIPDSIGSDDFMECQLFLTEATGDEQNELWVFQVRHFINGGSEMDLDVSSVSDGGFIENTITVTGEAGNMTFVKGYYRIDSFALTSDIAEHNESSSAHSDIRTELAGKVGKELSGQTFNMSNDADTKRLLSLVGQALGATVTHTSTDDSTGASVASMYGINPTDTTTFGELQTKAGFGDSAVIGDL